jgi:hypothetical protein
VRRFLIGLCTIVLLVGFLGIAFRMGPTPAVDSSTDGSIATPSSVLDATPFDRLESSTPVFDVLYRYGQNVPAANGAYGPNTTAPRSAWYLEYQRAGGTDVIAGVLRHDTALITMGLKMFRFGLDREAANGSFPGSAWPFHGTAMFLSEAAPALVMLQSSPYAAQFSADITRDSTLMKRAAHYMVSTVHGAGNIDDRVKNHRWFEAAIALGATGTLAHDRVLVDWSRKYAWHGIRMQRADGVMPENGGHDSGYQALGMVSASRYLEMVATGGLYRALHTALQRGEAWELSRIAPDGSVNQAGDTRTAGCKEHDPAGRCKTVFYAPIFSALAHWATISGSAKYASVSHQVWLRSGYGGH